jgi:hypothetical protein
LEENLIYSNIQYKSDLNLDKILHEEISDSFKYELYNPITLEKLNLKICKQKNLLSNVLLPEENMKKIQVLSTQRKSIKIKNKGNIVYDPYNGNSSSLYTRCYSVQLNESDTSLNYRRTKMFQNETITCSNNCTFMYFDENNYKNCECPLDENEDNENENEEIFSNSTALYLFKFPHWNIDIVYCYYTIVEEVIQKIFNKNIFFFFYKIFLTFLNKKVGTYF